MSWLFKLCAGKRSRAYEKDEEEVVDGPLLHYNCRTTDATNPKKIEKERKKGQAPSEADFIQRPYIADDNVPWPKHWPDYNPVEFTSDKILGVGGKPPDYADPNDPKEIKHFNNIDEIKHVNKDGTSETKRLERRSFTGTYSFDPKNGRPLNIVGRTGVTGRGHLGRWGPNHAGDPIVTRWKRDKAGKIIKEGDKPILQFAAIERRDTKEWAIPGGMVDPGETITKTLKREFMEEAKNSNEMSAEKKAEVEKELEKLFSNGVEIYKGYVDDPRNTDNAWMETTAYNFHDESGKSLSKFELTAGDDAKKAKWMDINDTLNLYASHKEFIKRTALRHKAYWFTEAQISNIELKKNDKKKSKSK